MRDVIATETHRRISQAEDVRCGRASRACRYPSQSCPLRIVAAWRNLIVVLRR